jgi:PIF1-like helicase
MSSVLAEELRHSNWPPPGRQQGSQADESISSKKAKRKSVYASGQDGQLHQLSETKPKPRKQKADDATKLDGWDANRICNVCNGRFNTTSKLARHLADPTAHLETLNLEKRAPKASRKFGDRAGMTALPSKATHVSALPVPMSPLHRIRQASAFRDRWKSSTVQSSKKRSWEQYTEPENRHPPHSQYEAFRNKGNALESNVIDLTSPEKASSTSLLRQPLADRPSRRTPTTPTKTQPYPTRNLASNSPYLETIRSDLNFELSPPNAQTKPPTEPPLCPEQRRLIEIIMSGRNVFYTGSAGCGKSTVLKNFVGRLKAQLVTRSDDQGKPKREPTQVDIIAPTGRAALDINGSTFWTYAGWNPDSMKRPLEELKDAAEHGKWVRKRLKATDVLVIDEISMVENHHLERLNHVMQAARRNLQAFGGVQLVVTGDFW